MRSTTKYPMNPRQVGLVATVAIAISIAGCATPTSNSSGASPPVTDSASSVAPPAVINSQQPAACILDSAALNASTGLTWTINAEGSSEYACTYTPNAPGYKTISIFIVDSPPGTDPLANLRSQCTSGSIRYASEAANGAFVCQVSTQSRDVVGVMSENGKLAQLFTINGAPEGTTREAIAAAFLDQIARIELR